MINGRISIVFDCGATNIRVSAIDEAGVIIRSESAPNNTIPDPEFPDYRIWDIPEIWGKMCRLSRNTIRGIPPGKIAGITVTTFGVDGALFSQSGKILYPMISWQCERTLPILKNIDKYITNRELYSETAILPYSFNTINKIIWLNENRPALVNEAHRFLFAPSVFLYLLSGQMSNDTTMAGTSMMTSIHKKRFFRKILEAIDTPRSLFGKLVEPGVIVGEVSSSAALKTGLPKGIPVVSTGHDTQFAVFGSGAQTDQPVLSSGTWEVLMVRSDSFRAGENELINSITTEFDSRPGLFNIGNQWIASGVLEWVKHTYFKTNTYLEMISEADNPPVQYSGLQLPPDIFDGGITHATQILSKATGNYSRGEIYRSVLELLAKRLSQGKEILEIAGGFKSENIICVGGGTQNSLWNRLKSKAHRDSNDVVRSTRKHSSGSILFVQSACGISESPEAARDKVKYRYKIIYPD